MPGRAQLRVGRLAPLQENIRIDRAEAAERIRYLVSLARTLAAGSHADLAMDLLMSAARRCWQGTPDVETRLLISETALELTAGRIARAGATSSNACRPTATT